MRHLPAIVLAASLLSSLTGLRCQTELIPAPGSLGSVFAGASCYDSRRDRLVVLGPRYGTSRTGGIAEWDGARWTQIELPPTTAVYDFGAMAYDLRRGASVFFAFGRTFEWDGAIWLERTPAASPPTLNEHAMAYDLGRGRVVLTGGQRDRFWEWDGTGWSAREPVLRDRATYRLVHDPLRACTVVVGRVWTGRIVPGFTQLYGPVDAAVQEPFGSGCAASVGVPELSSEPHQKPWIGDVFELQVTNLAPGAMAWLAIGASDRVWIGLSLPFDLQVLGLAGCSALTSAEVIRMLPAPSPAGISSTTIQVPGSRSLIGARLFEQAIVFDPALTNPLRLAVSNGAASTVGSR